VRARTSWKKTGGVQTTIYNSLTRFAAACGTLAAACDGFGTARNTPTTFDVFLWLQVTNVDVSFLHSALARDVQPNRKQVCYFLRIHNFVSFVVEKPKASSFSSLTGPHSYCNLCFVPPWSQVFRSNVRFDACLLSRSVLGFSANLAKS